MTPLDQAHAQMMADEDDATLRLRYFEQLARSPLFLLLKDPPEGETIAPVTEWREGFDCVLAFDDEARLADHAGAGAHHVALPGREIVGMLAGRGIGLAINPGSGVSDFLLAPESLDWLNAALSSEAAETLARPSEFRPPGAPDPALLAALAQGLKAAPGLAGGAWLAEALYDDGRRGLFLGIVGAAQAAESVLRRIAQESVTFRDPPVTLDLAFLDPESSAARALARAGLEIPLRRDAPPAPPAAPGSDPDRPPRLR